MKYYYNKFIKLMSDEDLSDPEIVKDYIESFLECEGFNILSKNEHPNERFLNQEPELVGWNPTEWFGFKRIDPEYNNEYDTEVKYWKVNDYGYLIFIYTDNSGNKCIKVKLDK